MALNIKSSRMIKHGGYGVSVGLHAATIFASAKRLKTHLLGLDRGKGKVLVGPTLMRH